MESKKDILDLAIDEAKAQEMAAEKKKRGDTFRKELKAELKNLVAELEPTEEQQIKVTLSEYISLVCMARDLDSFKGIIADNLTLGYIDGLRLNNSDAVVNAFAVLFPEEARKKYEKLRAKEKATITEFKKAELE